ncbi:MAG: GAF domain-containing protein [Chloroflexi bacterium]|nr:GAF domain-containing protein [Chloroflexota bacterium]
MDYQQRNQELAILNTIAATVNQSLDLNQILNNALNEVLTLEMFDNDAKGMILLLNEQASSLTLAAHQGVMDDPPCLHHSVRVGECLCGLAVLQQQIVISKDSSNDPRHMRHWPNMPHHQDICLPIKARGKVLGTLNVRVPPHRQMEQRELDLLNAVTDQMGVAIEKRPII